MHWASGVYELPAECLAFRFELPVVSVRAPANPDHEAQQACEYTEYERVIAV